MKKYEEIFCDFGEWIKENRIKLEITQQELADMLGVSSRQIIANYESRGIKRIKPSLIEKLQDIFKDYKYADVLESLKPKDENEKYPNFGEWIKTNRIKLKLTHQEIADVMGFTRNAINNYEARGASRNINPSIVMKLQVLFNDYPYINKIELNAEDHSNIIPLVSLLMVSNIDSKDSNRLYKIVKAYIEE